MEVFSQRVATRRYRFIFRRGTASLRSTAARACCLRSRKNPHVNAVP